MTTKNPLRPKLRFERLLLFEILENLDSRRPLTNGIPENSEKSILSPRYYFLVQLGDVMHYVGTQACAIISNMMRCNYVINVHVYVLGCNYF